MGSVQHAFSQIEQCGLLAVSAGALLRQQMLVSLLRVDLSPRLVEEVLVLEIRDQAAVPGAKQSDAGDTREADDVRVVRLALRLDASRFGVHRLVVFPPGPSRAKQLLDRAADRAALVVLGRQSAAVDELLLRPALPEERRVNGLELRIGRVAKGKGRHVGVDDETHRVTVSQ